MGINKFIYFLLICAILVLFYEKDKKVIIVKEEEKPELSFYNSTAYEITTAGVDKVVRSNEAYMYKNREELIDGTIITKGDTKNSANIISGKQFIKIENDVYVDGDVNLQLANDIDVTTEQLEYNIKTKVATNSSPFTATQNNNVFDGKNLYLDMTAKYIKATDAKMKIEVINE